VPSTIPRRLIGALITRRGRIGLLLAVPALGASLAGCGVSQPGATAAVATPAAVVAAHGSAQAMYREMTQALRRIHTVGFSVEIKANHGPATTISAQIEVPGRAQATVMHGGEVVNERWLHDTVYFRYNYRALLDLSGDPGIASAVADRWIQIPESEMPLTQAMSHMATHKMMQECDILGPTGKLTVGHPTEVNGLPAVTLRDHGGKPGTASRTITLSADAPYLPLRIVQPDPVRPGGSAFDDCFNTHASRSFMRRAQQVSTRFGHAHHLRFKRGIEAITDYNRPLHLTRPPHPLEPRGSVASTSSSVAL
jgi:hypothetical protein